MLQREAADLGLTSTESGGVGSQTAAASGTPASVCGGRRGGRRRDTQSAREAETRALTTAGLTYIKRLFSLHSNYTLTADPARRHKQRDDESARH